MIINRSYMIRDCCSTLKQEVEKSKERWEIHLSSSPSPNLEEMISIDLKTWPFIQNLYDFLSEICN